MRHVGQQLLLLTLLRARWARARRTMGDPLRRDLFVQHQVVLCEGERLLASPHGLRKAPCMQVCEGKALQQAADPLPGDGPLRCRRSGCLEVGRERSVGLQLLGLPVGALQLQAGGQLVLYLWRQTDHAHAHNIFASG